MLRITPIADDGRTVRLKLEGRIHEDWARLLEQECERLACAHRLVLLDFSDVSFIDPPGVQAIRRIPNGHVRIINCPALIADLLQQGDRP